MSSGHGFSHAAVSAPRLKPKGSPGLGRAKGRRTGHYFGRYSFGNFATIV